MGKPRLLSAWQRKSKDPRGIPHQTCLPVARPVSRMGTTNTAGNKKARRCILVHRGPLGHALMVEAGGVEPPSENIPRKASTGLGQEQISPPCSPLTGHRAAIPPVQISWKLPAGAKLHQPDAMSPAGRISVGPSDVTINVVRCLAVFRQRKRSRNRCWQLLLCRFLRGQRRLDLQLWFPHPRRNQCAPNWEVLL